MPTPEQILEGLRSTANAWRWLAVGWHVYFAALAAGLLLGARPTRRVMGMFLGLPLLSVSALAWIAANPFSGLVFAAAGLSLIVLAARLPRDPVAIGPRWAVVAGLVMFAFGWLYPHFVEGASLVTYAYAAPTGLIPCPTLSIVIGLALATGGLGSRAWSAVLAVVGLFYGVFGALRLEVGLDWFLLLGAAVLAGVSFALARSERPADSL